MVRPVQTLRQGGPNLGAFGWIMVLFTRSARTRLEVRARRLGHGRALPAAQLPHPGVARRLRPAAAGLPLLGRRGIVRCAGVPPAPELHVQPRQPVGVDDGELHVPGDQQQARGAVHHARDDRAAVEPQRDARREPGRQRGRRGQVPGLRHRRRVRLPLDLVPLLQQHARARGDRGGRVASPRGGPRPSPGRRQPGSLRR